MKIGDLVQRKNHHEWSRHKGLNSLAIVTGFDSEGDLRLRHVNPVEGWENKEDVDYKKDWDLVNACD